MKRLFSLLLVFCLCLSMLPAAWADAEDTAEEEPAAPAADSLPQTEEAEEPEAPSEEPEEPAEAPEEPAETPAEDESPAGEPETEDADEAGAEAAAETEEVSTPAMGATKPQNGWYNDGKYTYYIENGEEVINQTRQIGGSWYYFGTYGRMLDNAASSGYRARSGGKLYCGEWYEETKYGTTYRYYYGTDCEALRGAAQVDGVWYYFYTDGQALNNREYDPYRAHEGGRLYQNEWYRDGEGLKYYYGSDCKLIKSTAAQIDGVWYYFQYSGQMLDGKASAPYRAYAGGSLYRNEWFTDSDGTRYYYGDDCAMLKSGKYQLDGDWYYFDYNGVMLDNNVYSGYRARPGGKLYCGEWYRDESGAQYYYGEDCKIAKSGILQIDGGWYYLDSSGAMLDDGAASYKVSYSETLSIRAHAGGLLYQNEWYQDADGSFYYGEDFGLYKSGKYQIDGDWYYFDSEGVMLDDAAYGSLYRAHPGGKLYRNEWYDGVYYGDDCTMVSFRALQVDGVWYYFTGDGSILDDGEDGDYRAHPGGRLYQNEWYGSYYYGDDCREVTGYQVIDGRGYYFNKYGTRVSEPGIVYGTRVVIDEEGYAFLLNEAGWSICNGNRYYCLDGQVLQDRVAEIDGAIYGFDKQGRLYTNTTFYAEALPSSQFYYSYFHAGSDGKCVTSIWLKETYWYYFGADGAAYRDGTFTIDGNSYTFDVNAWLSAKYPAWKQRDGGWFYYLKDWKYATYWQKIGTKWYYFGSDGRMATGKTDFYDGVYYYFDQSGAMVSSKWVQEDGAWLYVNSKGIVTTGWAKLSGKWYWFDAEGHMVTGWQSIEGSRYYFSEGGVMQTGKWVQENGSWRYLGGSGAVSTGWQKISGKWYYFDPSGSMVSGWQNIDGSRYHFASSGAMDAGKWLQSGSKWYYLKSGGAACTNEWFKSGGKWYYFGSDGAMLTGASLDQGGKTYYFDANGVCTNP